MVGVSIGLAVGYHGAACRPVLPEVGCQFRQRKGRLPLCGQPFHAGADLNIVEEFVNSITKSNEGVLSSTIESSIESHVVCYEAETSRLTNQTILID